MKATFCNVCSAMKLTQDQLYALVEYHLGQDKVISMQLEATEIIRQRVDSEFHSLFDLPYNSNSATDVQASIHLKVLMETD